MLLPRRRVLPPVVVVARKLLPRFRYQAHTRASHKRILANEESQQSRQLKNSVIMRKRSFSVSVYSLPCRKKNSSKSQRRPVPKVRVEQSSLQGSLMTHRYDFVVRRGGSDWQMVLLISLQDFRFEDSVTQALLEEHAEEFAWQELKDDTFRQQLLSFKLVMAKALNRQFYVALLVCLPGRVYSCSDSAAIVILGTTHRQLDSYRLRRVPQPCELEYLLGSPSFWQGAKGCNLGLTGPARQLTSRSYLAQEEWGGSFRDVTALVCKVKFQ